MFESRETSIPASVAAMDKFPLTCIAKSIVQHAKILDGYNMTHEVPPASFDHETFADLPIDVEKARNVIVDLAQDLKRLAQCPRDLPLQSLNTVCIHSLDYLF